MSEQKVGGMRYWLVGAIHGALIGFVTGGIVGGCQRDQLRQEALDNDAAYYTVDPRTGEREFHWGKRP